MLDRKFECLLSLRAFDCAIDGQVKQLQRLNISIERYTRLINTKDRFVGIPRKQVPRRIELLERQRSGLITTIKGSACKNCPFKTIDLENADLKLF